jgi:hypothetical protein
VTTEPLPLKGVPRPKVCKVCQALPRAERPKGHPLPAPYQGPRCFTHERARLKDRKARRHENDSQRVYGMPAGFLARLLAFQGHRCAVCNRKLTKVQRDHDHRAEERGEFSMRGCLCRSCNDFLGYVRDDPEVGHRLVRYLDDPPARQLMRLIEREQGTP